ncbi:MAG: hypothetical protein CL912_02925 [Deltaproteobacteria bacterium]|nr:hypothetical protein [Deltaproteobacteria bacterium]
MQILRLKQPQLAHWVVASSLSNPQYPLHDALKPITDPVKELLATKTLKLRQQQLKNYEQFISGYNWTLATNVPKI